MVERFLEIFMDNFSIYRDSFDQCLYCLELVLKRCTEKNLTLNWEKCSFIVQYGIVLGHEISRNGIKVDKEKIDIVTKLPIPKCVKNIRSFFGQARFYHMFIKDFCKIDRLLTNLLTKDVLFIFDDGCLNTWEKLKMELISTPIISAPDLSKPFEIMCDVSILQ